MSGTEKARSKKAAAIAKGKIQRERARVNKTLSLDLTNYDALKRMCQKEGWTMSAVVDELIAAFLEN